MSIPHVHVHFSQSHYEKLKREKAEAAEREEIARHQPRSPRSFAVPVDEEAYERMTARQVAPMPGFSRAADVVASGAAREEQLHADHELVATVAGAKPTSSGIFVTLKFVAKDGRTVAKWDCRRDTSMVSVEDLLLGGELSNEDAEQCVVVEGLGELPELSFFQADLPNARAFEKWGDFARLKDDLVVELNGQRFEVGQRRKHDKTKVQA